MAHGMNEPPERIILAAPHRALLQAVLADGRPFVALVGTGEFPLGIVERATMGIDGALKGLAILVQAGLLEQLEGVLAWGATEKGEAHGD